MSIEVNLIGEEKLRKEIQRLIKEFPEEVRKVMLETAIVDIESYAKTNDIPVDTGRLRSSIYTKYVKNVRIGGSESKTSHNYSDNFGQTYNGTLSESVDIDSIVVGTNVEYAQKINRIGGGGENSGRISEGSKRSKGYGKAFFDKAWSNGKQQLAKNLADLAKRVDKI